PTGDSFESRCSAGFASAEPTMWYSIVSFASTSFSRTFEPIETTSLLTSPVSITRAATRRSSSVAIRCSSIACSFFASSYSEFSAMSPNSRAMRMRFATSRRFSAGLVCSAMVSCAGIEHRNARTLGYLRVGADEHPLAIQIFGSEPRTMAEAARMVEAAGADIVDINFGCPVKKVTKTGAGATLLDDPDQACRVVEAVASAVSVPVSVKMRRGLENGSRACLSLGPRLVEAGAASLTLHPRSAKQMYTGAADHSLTAELVSLVDVPVVASGDITSRARAHAVLATTRAAAVMVGRAAQGNPWALREILD